MNDEQNYTNEFEQADNIWPGSLVIAELVPEADDERPTPAQTTPGSPRLALPLTLFILTCLSTFMVSGLAAGVVLGKEPTFDWGKFLWGGFCYAVPLMTILICHEAGHFLQSVRYGVRASYPFFIPMPISPIGTMGAVIAMSSNMKDRRALFDIGITGPLAGLVPTIIFCVWGLHY